MPPWGSERSPGPILTTIFAFVAIVAVLGIILVKTWIATGTH
jgi:hypothetical protein